MRFFLLWILLALPLAALAGVKSQAGPYHIDLQSNPSVIPVGQAILLLKVTDQGGKPVDGLQIRTLARMPGMSMGEREQLAKPVSGSPGTYSALAIFAMAGAYELSLDVDGTLGKASTVLTVNTGQDLGGSGGGFQVQSLLPWIAGLLLLVYVLVKVRRSGQGLSLKGMFTFGSISGLALLAVLLFVAIYVVNTKRRQGSMTPLEAQVMEMNT
ncbi:MAG: FixH family protein, partial [Fimbriimonadaceae bacterium]|nr:FixH family protein [Fimbriimonadaceae bacterium]